MKMLFGFAAVAAMGMAASPVLAQNKPAPQKRPGAAAPVAPPIAVRPQVTGTGPNDKGGFKAPPPDALFNMMDGNHDGSVSKKEFMAAAGGKGAESAFSSMDKDKNGALSKGEFANQAKPAPMPGPPPGPPKVPPRK